MNETVITSRQNPLVKQIQAIRDDRSAPTLFLEGPRLVREALSAGGTLEMLVMSDRFSDAALEEAAQGQTRQLFRVSESVFDALSDVDQPQGVLAIARRPSSKWGDLVKKAPAPILILDGIQDTGNAASIVRTAEAAGAAGLVTTPSSARLFSPKALRAAAGSTLRIPILEHLPTEAISREIIGAGYELLTTVVEKGHAASLYSAIDWKKPHAVVLGQEGQGISKSWKGKNIFIPMQAPVESLNVAAAAAVVLFEAARQRG
jgi:TrmH family RNA methyltransferase